MPSLADHPALHAGPISGQVSNQAGAAARPTRVRYGIIALIFLITSINYADRATFSIAGNAASGELGLSPVQTGFILSAFAWAYVLAQIPGGALLDRFGTKRIYAGAIAIWSVFTATQGLAGLIPGLSALAMLFGLRFLVGLAEAPSFPGNARLVAAWFPGPERGTASAIFNSAQYFSLVAFAPLMGWLVHDFGWRAVFWAMGALGLVATALFWRFIHSPVRHPRINAAELAHIEAGGGLVRMEEASTTVRARTFTWVNVRQLLANRMLLGIYLGQYCINVLTYFFVTWFPIYLVRERGLN
ncbi:MAG: MFS transporter, partial [Methylobacterium sp.]